MKSFFSFLSEARSSSVSQQAQTKGLTGDGHGNWYDKEGSLVAKTEKGRLVFFDKKQPKQEDEPKPKSEPKSSEETPQPEQKISADVQANKLKSMLSNLGDE